MSKAFGLITRFSEDIDITIFRDDLGEAADVAGLAAFSGKPAITGPQATVSPHTPITFGFLITAVTDGSRMRVGRQRARARASSPWEILGCRLRDRAVYIVVDAHGLTQELAKFFALLRRDGASKHEP